jgi:hypothetical protein
MGARIGTALTNRIVKNPKLSLIFLAPGIFFLYYGNSTGELLGPVKDKSPVMMTVTEVYNKNGRTIFPDYKARGYVAEEAGIIEVSISKRQYKTLENGDEIEVLKNPKGSPPYIFARKLKSARPIFNVLGFWFSWHGILGAIFMILCPITYYDAKRKLEKQELKQTFPGR